MSWEKYQRNQEANTVTLLPVEAIPVGIKGVGGRNRKKQDATPKTSSTYFDKLLQKQTGLFYLFLYFRP